MYSKAGGGEWKKKTRRSTNGGRRYGRANMKIRRRNDTRHHWNIERKEGDKKGLK